MEEEERIWAEDYFADLQRKEKKEKEITEYDSNKAMEEAIDAIKRLDNTRR